MTTLPIAPLAWLALAIPSPVQAGVAAAADQPGALELGPMLGATSAQGTRIWVKASRAAESGVIVGERADLRDGWAIDGPKLTGASDHMGVVEVSGLRPGTRYFYRVLIDGDVSSPIHSFVTAPPEGASVRLRLATTSCVGLPEDAERSWAELAKVPIDLLLRLGDNVYAGSTDPDVQRRIYYAHRRIPAHRAVVGRTPSLAIWDDWDYSGDNSDGGGAGQGLIAAQLQAALAQSGLRSGVRPRRVLQAFVGRHRPLYARRPLPSQPERGPDDDRKTMLGRAQLAWLQRELAASRATFKLLASGGEWQSRGRVDAWRSFRRERDALFRFIRDHRITGVVLLSGDRHITAGYQVLGRFFEITSGPFGTENHEPPYNPDEMLLLHDRGAFFVVLEVDTTGGEPSLTVEVHEVGRGLVRRRPFSWQEVNGEVAVPTCDLLPECRD